MNLGYKVDENNQIILKEKRLQAQTQQQKRKAKTKRLTQEACKSLKQNITPPPTEGMKRLKQSLSDGWRYRLTNKPGIYEASIDGVTWKRV